HLRVQVNGNATGTISNTAQTRSNETPTPVVSVPVAVTISSPLNLTVQKQVNLQTAAPGDELEYVIGFRNNGAATVTGAVIRDQIPTGVQFVVASQGVVPQNGALVWNLPAINPGADGSV